MWSLVLRKLSTHILSLVNGWIWSNLGLGAQIYVETVLRKRVFIFLSVFAVGLGSMGDLDGVKPLWKKVLTKGRYSFS